ncbi:hypothetical protein KSS87_002048, partial [Heliosperma pusillum]
KIKRSFYSHKPNPKLSVSSDTLTLTNNKHFHSFSPLTSAVLRRPISSDDHCHPTTRISCRRHNLYHTLSHKTKILIEFRSNSSSFLEF